MNHDLRTILDGGSAAFRALNAHLVSGQPAKPEPALGKPVSDTQGQAGGKGSVGKRVGKLARITLVAFRHRLLDDDHNLGYSFKHIQDAIADTLLPGLPPGRADAHFRWEYGQTETRGTEGVIVKIEAP